MENIPFTTDADVLGVKPPMQTREFVFDYLLTELDAIDSDLAAPKSNVYGRSWIKLQLWMLKAKLLLNAKVFTNKERSADAFNSR